MVWSKKKEEISTALGDMVKAKFSEAQDANREPHQRCHDCLRVLDGEIDTSQDADFDETDEFKVAMNITLPLSEQVQSMMVDTLDPISAQPFVLEPAPIAQLPEEVEADLQDAIEQNLEQIMMQYGRSPDDMRNIIGQMYQTTLEYQQEEAKQRAAALTTVVNDKLKKSGFEAAFDDFLQNFIVYPTGFMKGPVAMFAKVKSWNGTTMQVTDEMQRKVYTVSPFDIFPSPHARDLNTCEYVIERARYSSNDLLNMIGMPGFDSDGIAEVFEQHTSFIIPYTVGDNDSRPDADPETDDIIKDDRGFYDVLIFNGKIRGADLVEYGIEVEDERRWYESELWVVDNIVIKAVLNPDELERRPYYAASMYLRPGELWGRSVVEIIKDAQLQCTAAGRALVRNMGFSSGPMGEVETSRVLGDDDPTEVYPLMMKAVKSSANGNPAYRWHNVPSLAQELMAVYDKFTQIAYQLVGIPQIAFGNMQGAATLGRTSGGISMVMNQASKPVKKAMRRVEGNVIEPMIQRFVDFELMYNDDDTIKGDVNVSATGIRGLQEQEQQEGKLEWALQSLAPFAQGVQVPPEYFMRLLEKLLQANGIDTKGLPNYAAQDAIARDLGMAGVQPGAEAGQVPNQPGSPVSQVPLDGRSQNAVDTINNMNNPTGLS